MSENISDSLATALLDTTKTITNKKISNAEYDKSYSSVIMGRNKVFVDDVSTDIQNKLITEHNIADDSKPIYYSFQINGQWYVKQSPSDFKLYENVVIRVPNGNWNRMFIEVQRDTVDNGNGESPVGDFGRVSFEKNKMYYNGETYHVQYGVNKRIMCVTKGDKYALISSTDPIDSRIEAATAVMKGLTEDWDIEFDYYGLEWAGGITLYVYGGSINLLEGYSGGVRCDWGDGTVNEEASHTYYNTGAVTVKVKLLDAVSERITVNLWVSPWNSSNNALFNEQHIGARAYIGGSIENIVLGHSTGVTHICFGEKIKSINGTAIYQSGAEGCLEMGIPPFIENISDETYRYSCMDYIYIPESCVNIGTNAFYCNSASEIEIEEKGNTITIGGYAFQNAATATGIFNRVDVVKIPSRAVISSSGLLRDCSVGAIVFGRGVEEIPGGSFEYAGKTQAFSELCSNRPYFIFFPDTVNSIGYNFLSGDSRPVYIICEGSWSSITKASNWDGANGSRENVTIIENDELYRSADKIINTFIRRS